MELTPLILRKPNRWSLEFPQLTPLLIIMLNPRHVLFDLTDLKFRYKQDPQIVAMTNLVAAYQRQDVHEAEKIIKSK